MPIVLQYIASLSLYCDTCHMARFLLIHTPTLKCVRLSEITLYKTILGDKWLLWEDQTDLGFLTWRFLMCWFSKAAVVRAGWILVLPPPWRLAVERSGLGYWRICWCCQNNGSDRAFSGWRDKYGELIHFCSLAHKYITCKRIPTH